MSFISWASLTILRPSSRTPPGRIVDNKEETSGVTSVPSKPIRNICPSLSSKESMGKGVFSITAAAISSGCFCETMVTDEYHEKTKYKNTVIPAHDPKTKKKKKKKFFFLIKNLFKLIYPPGKIRGMAGGPQVRATWALQSCFRAGHM